VGRARSPERSSRRAESYGPADDIGSDVVSIQYEMLKAATVHAEDAADVEGHDDVAEFIEQCRREDANRAVRTDSAC